MRRFNKERNETLLHFFKSGYTIDDTSVLTNIPRSTVGYYFKKFRKYKRDGVFDDLFRVKLGSDQSPQINQLPTSIFVKTMVQKKIAELVMKGDFKEAFYSLSTLKLLIELSKYYSFSPDEIDELNRAFQTEDHPPYKEDIQSFKKGKQRLTDLVDKHKND